MYLTDLRLYSTSNIGISCPDRQVLQYTRRSKKEIAYSFLMGFKKYFIQYSEMLRYNKDLSMTII